MPKIVLSTLMAVALAASSVTMTADAFAQSPTQARVNAAKAKHKAAKLQKYYPCAEFALRVFQGCMSQAAGNSTKVRACRTHYTFSLGQCRRYAGL